jgi:hypothetical protein
MAKTFYTEHEIEDLFKSGVTRLEVNENVVLTGLAYEKAQKLGMQLVQQNEQPTDAPVRPYISKATSPAASSDLHLQVPVSIASTPVAVPPADLSSRIKNAVIAKLGAQVDPSLLDSIIRRVLDQVKV